MKAIKTPIGLLLIVALLLALLPSTLFVGAEELPKLQNLQVSDSGILTWDAYPDAVDYFVYDDGGQVYTTTFNFRLLLTMNGALEGVYAVKVAARDINGREIAVATSPEYYYFTLGKTPTPTGICWDGYTARWDAVENAYRYWVTLYVDDEMYDTFETQDAQYDFSTLAEDSSRAYTFSVRALKNEYSFSDFSRRSDVVYGRFEKQLMTLNLSGDILSWEQYVTSEDNPASVYYLNQGADNPVKIKALHTATSVDLRALLDAKNAPDGRYAFSVEAKWMGQTGYVFTVSAVSNEVIYYYYSSGVPTPYAVMATAGTAWCDGVPVTEALPGQTVTLIAEEPPEGLVFDRWQINKGKAALSDEHAAVATFEMPFCDVALEATYVTPIIYAAAIEPITFETCVVGYEAAPSRAAITVTNTGNQPFSINMDSLLFRDSSGAFAFGRSGTHDEIAVGEAIADWWVTPRRGLAAGTYTATVAFVDEDGALAPISVPVTFTVLQKGDVDANGIINMADAFLLYRAASGQVMLTDIQQAAGDMDDSGILNMADAFALYRLVSGGTE
ncbi:MAG: dockerin type I repeat-containing protein [Clostridia bacterium]|nr:dockerin type I repeat-containing protein [Clostridia bacterium]